MYIYYDDYPNLKAVPEAWSKVLNHLDSLGYQDPPKHIEYQKNISNNYIIYYIFYIAYVVNRFIV